MGTRAHVAPAATDGLPRPCSPIIVMALYSIVDRAFIGNVVGVNALSGLSAAFPSPDCSCRHRVVARIGWDVSSLPGAGRS